MDQIAHFKYSFNQQQSSYLKIITYLKFIILEIKQQMKGSLNLKTTLKKRNSAIGTATQNNLQKIEKGSSSSISNSNSTINSDRLVQLKEKLQKQKQMMKKTGKRFKEVNTIEIQTLQLKPEKQLEKPLRIQSGKSSVSSSTSTNTGLISINHKVSSDKGSITFGSKKNLFLKKDSNKTKEFSATQKSQVRMNQSEQKNQQQKLQYQSKKQSINLMQLSRVLQLQKKPSVSKQKQKKNALQKSSKMFQKQIKEQKRRNMEILTFLKEISLEPFAEQFVNMGYDQVDTLIEVTVEDLNHMMMRAHQQDTLMKAIKKYKLQNQIQQEKQKPLIDKPSSIKTTIGFRPRSAVTTEPSSPQNSRIKFQQNLSTISKTSKRLKTDISQSSLMNKSSFFYTVGSKQWSLQSQIRRACSGCFKIIPSNQMSKVGECFYCQKCNKNSIDTSIYLNDSMVRFYKREDVQQTIGK